MNKDNFFDSLKVWLSLRPQVTAHIFMKVWRGQYSLTRLLLCFFVFGGFLFPIILGLPFILTGIFAPDMLRPSLIVAFAAYRLVTTVGVWRSANMLAATYYKPGSTLGVSVPFRAFMVKLFVFMWITVEIHRITGFKNFIDIIKYFSG